MFKTMYSSGELFGELIWFLEKNGILYKGDGSKRIADNALVTLMIAESKPDEKEMMVKVIVNLINTKN